MKKVMIKAEAKKAAEDKHVVLGHQGSYAKILHTLGNVYVVKRREDDEEWQFPFTDIKNGDVCLASHRDGDTGTVFFNEGRLWFYWDGKGFNHECSWSLIKTTGFNVLEDMK